jgi:hypothetical protein
MTSQLKERLGKSGRRNGVQGSEQSCRGLLLRPSMAQSLVGRAAAPGAFGGTGFQPVRRTGKMPVPPKTFPDSHAWAFGPPINYEKLMMSIPPTLNLELFSAFAHGPIGPPVKHEKFMLARALNLEL